MMRLHQTEVRFRPTFPVFSPSASGRRARPASAGRRRQLSAAKRVGRDRTSRYTHVPLLCRWRLAVCVAASLCARPAASFPCVALGVTPPGPPGVRGGAAVTGDANSSAVVSWVSRHARSDGGGDGGSGGSGDSASRNPIVAGSGGGQRRVQRLASACHTSRRRPPDTHVGGYGVRGPRHACSRARQATLLAACWRRRTLLFRW